MKQKRTYEQPSTEVVMLQQTQLLAGSNGSVNIPGSFGEGGDPLNPSPSRMDDWEF